MAIDALALSPGWVPADTFGDRLRAVRRHLNLRVEQIAELCEVPLATWSSWEHGRRPRRLDEVVQTIATQTGVDRNWLMWGVGGRDLHERSSQWSTHRTLDGILATLGMAWGVPTPAPVDGDLLPLWPRLVPDADGEDEVEVPAPAAPGAGGELRPAA